MTAFERTIQIRSGHRRNSMSALSLAHDLFVFVYSDRRQSVGLIKTRSSLQEVAHGGELCGSRNDRWFIIHSVGGVGISIPIAVVAGFGFAHPIVDDARSIVVAKLPDGLALVL
jgi:hypothetical protein